MSHLLKKKGDLTPVTVSQLYDDTYRFGYSLADFVASFGVNPLNRPTILSVSGVIQGGEIFDNHGNANLQTGFTFGDF